jgi:hypothetical protein
MRPEAGVATLSYHSDAKRWLHVDANNCQLVSVAKGQEFVLEVGQPALLDHWLAGLFADVPSHG